MKYYTAIISLFVLSFLNIISLLYISSLSKEIEKENSIILKNINSIKDQININEIEYSLYTSYDYLNKLHKIYFEDLNNNFEPKRISYFDLKNQNIKNLYTVGIK